VSRAQSFNLISPTSTSVNIPANNGIAIEANNAGRAGQHLAWAKVSGPGTVTSTALTSAPHRRGFFRNGTYPALH
jgi:hypothetical protein